MDRGVRPAVKELPPHRVQRTGHRRFGRRTACSGRWLRPPRGRSVMRGSKDMSEPKSFASLSSSLLARKVQAPPAMRPQLTTTSSTLENFGGNAMGSVPAPTWHEPTDQVQAAPGATRAGTRGKSGGEGKRVAE